MCVPTHFTTFGWGSFVFEEERAVARNWLTWFWWCVHPQTPRWHTYNILIKEAWEEFQCNSRYLCFQVPELWLPLFRYLIFPISLSLHHVTSVFIPFWASLLLQFQETRLFHQQAFRIIDMSCATHAFLFEAWRKSCTTYIYTHRPCSVSYCHHQACFI